MGPAESLGRRAETTLVDDIVDAIRERILLGELEPGLRIRQQQFAEVLGVSRTPLREAFQRLEADGWLQLRARRGAEVRPLTVDEACEIFTMRVVLETTAARLAARSHSEGDAARARALLERIPWGFDGASQNLTILTGPSMNRSTDSNPGYASRADCRPPRLLDTSASLPPRVLAPGSLHRALEVGA